MTNDFVMWSKIACHVKQFCATWPSFFSLLHMKVLLHGQCPRQIWCMILCNSILTNVIMCFIQNDLLVNSHKKGSTMGELTWGIGVLVKQIITNWKQERNKESKLKEESKLEKVTKKCFCRKAWQYLYKRRYPRSFYSSVEHAEGWGKWILWVGMILWIA